MLFRPPIRCRTLLAAAAIGAGASWCSATAPDAPPYSVAAGLFDQAKPDLGLAPVPGARTFTIFRPDDDTDKFSNGVVLIRFKGRFYAQWQSSARDEDSPDTWVACSTSTDGETWTPPQMLAPAGGGTAMHSSGGWWTDGATLVAYINVWPDGFGQGNGGHAEYRLSTDGQNWSEPRRLTDREGRPLAGIIEQDPHSYDARLFTAFHVPPGLIANPHFTDDPLGVSGWTAGAMANLPSDKSSSRELEPSLFRRDAELVMVFRDQASSYRQLAAVSRDRGATWTTPVPTEMPDSRSKQSAGNLPDGTAYLVNAPHAGRERLPLAVTLARDGRLFDRSFLLRGPADLPPLRYPGRYKRPGYHYPKSLVADGFLFVAYATNKEDVQVTRIPLSALQVDAQPR
jgi:hypothetical protein